MIVTAPEGVDIGRNVSDPGLTFSRFSGQLEVKLKRIGSLRQDASSADP
jgi:hypothetical protein